MPIMTRYQNPNHYQSLNDFISKPMTKSLFNTIIGFNTTIRIHYGYFQSTNIWLNKIPYHHIHEIFNYFSQNYLLIIEL